MEIDLTPTLIDMYRETFEGAVRPNWVWIVDGPAERSVLGGLAGVSVSDAFASKGEGRLSIAAHAAHLRYALDLTLKRLNGENPEADWQGSFETGAATQDEWDRIREELRSAYEGVLAFFDQFRETPIGEWTPIHVAGLVAMTGHNAYHLGAIRQLMLDVRDEGMGSES